MLPYGGTGYGVHQTFTSPSSYAPPTSSFNWGGVANISGALGGIATSIMGTIYSGQAYKMQARAEQMAAEYNAALALEQGHREEMRRRRIARRALSSQFVQMAAKSGTIAEEGGWLEALKRNAAEYEVHAMHASYAGRQGAVLEQLRGASAGVTGAGRAQAAYASGFNQIVSRTAGLFQSVSEYASPGSTRSNYSGTGIPLYTNPNYQNPMYAPSGPWRSYP